MNKRTQSRAHRTLGAWLAKHAPKGPPVAVASRASRRGDPFAPPPRAKAAPLKPSTR